MLSEKDVKITQFGKGRLRMFVYLLINLKPLKEYKSNSLSEGHPSLLLLIAFLNAKNFRLRM